jgi:hypothetical protein
MLFLKLTDLTKLWCDVMSLVSFWLGIRPEVLLSEVQVLVTLSSIGHSTVELADAVHFAL